MDEWKRRNSKEAESLQQDNDDELTSIRVDSSNPQDSGSTPCYFIPQQDSSSAPYDASGTSLGNFSCL